MSISMGENVSDPKSDGTLLKQLLKTRNFVLRPNMQFLTRIILIMGDVFFRRLDLPSKIATLQKCMVFDWILAEMIGVTYQQ